MERLFETRPYGRYEEMDAPMILALTAIFLGLMALVLVTEHR